MKQQTLFKLLSNYYAFYLKAHSYHWNVEGENFISIHKFLDEKYNSLIAEIDEIAERIRILGEKIPASFKQFEDMSILTHANENLTAKEMLEDLFKDNKKIIFLLEEALREYEEQNDTVTVDLLTQKLAIMQKDCWILSSITK